MSTTKPRLTRWIGIPAVLIVANVVLVFGVAEAGLGAGAAPSFPTSVTVGDTNVAASITLTNLNTQPNQADVNTVCNAGDGAPCPVGEPGITLIPSCGALGLFSVCDPSGADPGVFAVSATGTGIAGSACAGMIFNITTIAPGGTDFGQLRFTPQPSPAAHVLLNGFGSACTVAFTFDVLKAPTKDQDPGIPGLQTVQIVDNTQHSGTTASARGTSRPGVTVNRAQPTIVTTASATVALGGQLTDVAVVNGRVNPQPGATIDFRLYGPNDATCTGVPIFESLGVAYPAAGGPVTSTAFTPTVPGTYRWRATYSGDANNAPVAGACNDVNENVDVTKATPAITTVASGTVVVGGALTDRATVTGRVNPQSGATIDFRLYGPNDATCAGAPVFESLGVPYPVAGGAVTSAPFTTTAPGVYRWRAFYSGDANNAAAAGACNDPDENVTVTAPAVVPLAIASTASATITVGGQLMDHAVVTGRVNPSVSATITFRLYGPNDDTCARPPIFESVVPYGVDGGEVMSGAFTPTEPGVYRWRAFYSGDTNNPSISGECNAPNESTVVLPPPLVLPTGTLPATG